MAHTFEELVTLQHTADQAHAHVLQLRDDYGRPTVDWTAEQTETYDAAWKNWRKFAETTQAAVTAHAEAEGAPRFDVEAKVRKAAWHPADAVSA